MAGLVNVANVVEGDDVSGSLDALVDLIAALQDNLGTPSHILLDPLGWAELRKMKAGSELNSSLLGAGTTDATPMLLSLPVIVDPAVPTTAALWLTSAPSCPLSDRSKVATSEHQYFSSDSVLLWATWRFGHAVVRPNRIGTFTIGGGS